MHPAPVHGRALGARRQEQYHRADAVVSVRSILEQEARHRAQLQDLGIFPAVQLCGNGAAEGHVVANQITVVRLAQVERVFSSSSDDALGQDGKNEGVPRRMSPLSEALSRTPDTGLVGRCQRQQKRELYSLASFGQPRLINRRPGVSSAEKR